MSNTTFNTPTATPHRLVDKPATARRLLGRFSTHGSPATPSRSVGTSGHRPRGPSLPVTNLCTPEPRRLGLPFPSIPSEPTSAGPPLLPPAPIGTGQPFSYTFTCSHFPAMSAASDPRSPRSLTSGSNSSGISVSSGSQAQSVRASTVDSNVLSCPGAAISAFSPGTRANVVNGKRKQLLLTLFPLRLLTPARRPFR
jgi:hypothetical protein